MEHLITIELIPIELSLLRILPFAKHVLVWYQPQFPQNKLWDELDKCLSTAGVFLIKYFIWPPSSNWLSYLSTSKTYSYYFVRESLGAVCCNFHFALVVPLLLDFSFNVQSSWKNALRSIYKANISWQYRIDVKSRVEKRCNLVWKNILFPFNSQL